MTWIFEGVAGENNYRVRRLTIEDMHQILELQTIVIDALEDKQILQPLSIEEFEYILKGHGLMVGVFVDEQLIAFRALLEPADDEEHLGLDIGVPKGQLAHVLYQEISSVHPAYRGFRLQRVLADVVMKEIDKSRFDVVCATVMPFNIASMKDKFAQGMLVGSLKYKYGGKLRYVFYKHLHDDEMLLADTEGVLMSDTEAQQKLLKAGYVGIGLRLENDEWYVDYKRRG